MGAEFPASGAPSGAAGGVLAGTYPNPGFAVDMATQAELDTHAALPLHLTADRYRAQMAAQGYYAENFPRQSVVANSGPSSTVAYAVAIGLAAGDVVTNIHLLCCVLGSGFSGIGMKVGLYDKAQARLRVSGDVSALFSSTGPKICPLSSPYTVPTTDGYYAALLVIATTPPILERGSIGVAAGKFAGAAQAAAGSSGVVSDLNDPLVVTFTANAIRFWMGVS